MRRTARTGVVFVLGMTLVSVVSFSQSLSISGLPGAFEWQNQPRDWQVDQGRTLTISSGPKTDWFVDPFDGKAAKNAPILLFRSDSDYVLSAKVSVKFKAKWDAGALMLWGDDHHWAKLSFELSPEAKPTLVTVVTRGLSDDCNSVQVQNERVYLRIAKSAKTYVFYRSLNGREWQILRTFSLDTNLPVRTGFEAQSPAGSGATANFSEIRYSPQRIGDIYK